MRRPFALVKSFITPHLPQKGIYAKKSLPDGVTLKVRIKVQDIDEYAAAFSLFKVILHDYNRVLGAYGAILEFRNVPLQRQ
ncbi:MAG: hypothetical protein NC038_01600 [Paludibacter sp.]|nr:hypothetical protein [Bacteroidales bacterium]MCM1068904.1 hypothetical protein [Prevotella sp.]MCM1353165.1 hypothetical protein [Bacteroides sp.]MCM1442487.1 hypothetical protein [Muribaculum sp.]MCM1481330.1 hypothetical protein [Paludibacter sp.]